MSEFIKIGYLTARISDIKWVGKATETTCKVAFVDGTDLEVVAKYEDVVLASGTGFGAFLEYVKQPSVYGKFRNGKEFLWILDDIATQFLNERTAR